MMCMTEALLWFSPHLKTSLRVLRFSLKPTVKLLSVQSSIQRVHPKHAPCFMKRLKCGFTYHSVCYTIDPLIAPVKNSNICNQVNFKRHRHEAAFTRHPLKHRPPLIFQFVPMRCCILTVRRSHHRGLPQKKAEPLRWKSRIWLNF